MLIGALSLAPTTDSASFRLRGSALSGDPTGRSSGSCSEGTSPLVVPIANHEFVSGEPSGLSGGYLGARHCGGRSRGRP